MTHKLLRSSRFIFGHNLLSETLDGLLDRVLSTLSGLSQAKCSRVRIVVAQLDREVRISVCQFEELTFSTHPVSPLSCASFLFLSSISLSLRTAFVAASVVSMVDAMEVCTRSRVNIQFIEIVELRNGHRPWETQLPPDRLESAKVGFAAQNGNRHHFHS